MIRQSFQWYRCKSVHVGSVGITLTVPLFQGEGGGCEQVQAERAD